MSHPSAWQCSVPNRVPQLMTALDGLDAWLQRWGADSSARYLARLAVEELGTNIIKYGYDDRTEHVIVLSAACEERVFRLCLEDDGHEFNPCLSPEPDPNLDLAERAPGGWGLSLVRRLSAGMEYERRGNRNRVCVLVPRGPASAPV